MKTHTKNNSGISKSREVRIRKRSAKRAFKEATQGPRPRQHRPGSGN